MVFPVAQRYGQDVCGVGDDEDYKTGGKDIPYSGSSSCGTMDTWELATGDLFHHVVFEGSWIKYPDPFDQCLCYIPFF